MWTSPTQSKLQPISKLLPVPAVTRKGAGQQPFLNTGDKPQLLPNKNILSFKSLSPAEKDARFHPLNSSLLSGDGPACTPDPLEGCSIISSIRSRPGHKASSSLILRRSFHYIQVFQQASSKLLVICLESQWLGTEGTTLAPEMF